MADSETGDGDTAHTSLSSTDSVGSPGPSELPSASSDPVPAPHPSAFVPPSAFHIPPAAPTGVRRMMTVHAHGHAHFAHGHAHMHSHAAPPPRQTPPNGPPPQGGQRRSATASRPVPNMPQQNGNNQLGVVRDRLFQAMLVRMALWYASKVQRKWRRVLEFAALLAAIASFFTLVVIHVIFTRGTTNCLKDIDVDLPRDGMLRVEVVRNLAMLRKKEKDLEEYRLERIQEAQRAPPPVCTFSPKEVLQRGPFVIPAEIREMGYNGRGVEEPEHGRSWFSTVVGFIFPELLEDSRSTISPHKERERVLISDDDEYEEPISLVTHDDDEYAAGFERDFNSYYDPSELPYYMYRVEYSLLYGVLRLPADFMHKHNVTVFTYQIDSEDQCLGADVARWLMRNAVGYEDAVMSSLRQLADKTKDMGFIRDLRSNDHYHFVQLSTSKMSYITAMVIMLLFTFAISLLLRFSHHQIFLFIVDLLHMFEHNQPLAFPAAPLLTVILALVGMEAIMSEVFSDTTTAFYVILIVWLADQFDAICCQSPTSKRFWLRFFYLYQFFFYAYQYRFGGHYGTLALLTSSLFIFHSMMYFFHHYEIPYILYTDRLQRIMGELNNREPPVVQEVNIGPRSGDDASRPNQHVFGPRADTAPAGGGGASGASASAPVLRRVLLPDGGAGGPRREVLGVAVGANATGQPINNGQSYLRRMSETVNNMISSVVRHRTVGERLMEQVDGAMAAAMDTVAAE